MCRQRQSFPIHCIRKHHARVCIRMVCSSLRVSCSIRVPIYILQSIYHHHQPYSISVQSAVPSFASVTCFTTIHIVYIHNTDSILYATTTVRAHRVYIRRSSHSRASFFRVYIPQFTSSNLYLFITSRFNRIILSIDLE